MIEIMFRGQRLDNNEFEYGYLISDNVQTRIVKYIGKYNSEICECRSYEVKKETVGQFTGLKDIYQGDICKDDNGNIIEIVRSNHYQWGCKIIKGGVLAEGMVFPLWQYDKCEYNNNMSLTVIGNIHENKNLLK